MAGCRTVAPAPPPEIPLGGGGSSIACEALWRQVWLIAPKSHSPMDTSYYSPTVKELAGLFPKMHHKWQAEKWDCDDIAQETLVVARRNHLRRATNALCAGMIAYKTSKTNAHAAIIVRTSKGHWRVFDPAPHKWITLPPLKKIMWISI
jgi:hypothetical protein